MTDSNYGQNATNRGRIFRNKEPKSSDSPTHIGTLQIEDKTYWINAWTSVAKTTGERYFSISASLMQTKKKIDSKTELNDEIPF
jgi:hypothetical protein